MVSFPHTLGDGRNRRTLVMADQVGRSLYCRHPSF